MQLKYKEEESLLGIKQKFNIKIVHFLAIFDLARVLLLYCNIKHRYLGGKNG